MINTNGKKVTMATIKSFVKREKAANNLYIKTKSSFDGMVDCVMPTGNNSFHLVENKMSDSNQTLSDHSLGIPGAWFVGSSRDHFSPYNDNNFVGYEVYNCCGSFIIAMGKN